MWKKLLRKKRLSTGEQELFLSTFDLSTFHSLIVDRGPHIRLLLLTLELMSRMIEAMEGSFRIMSSTLRIELRTVA